ncbi:MAG TPA: hypothetical protein VFC30_07190 [Solirubrobacteraceae bacterium]|nr:hypothetical protein [Solirubrobacteraceae bacterium]
MGRAKRAVIAQAHRYLTIAEAVNTQDIDGLVMIQRRQDRRQTLSQHRLARPGRPHQHQVVSAGRGDQERLHRLALALHIGQVQGGTRSRRLRGARGSAHRGQRISLAAFEDPHRA